MKIIAATPKPYSATVYIAEMTSDELVALLMLSPYSEIPVEREAKSLLVKDRELQSGDIVPWSETEERKRKILEFMENRGSIESLMSQLKAAMTKLHNSLPK